MVEQELHNLIVQIQLRNCEEQTTEVKSAHKGCPEKLYDTISAFSNQDSGGVFVFGLNEQENFKKVGVYDAQDLQKKVMEYCEQMTPTVRPVFTVCEEGGMVFVSAEIPPIDITHRPCFKTAKGRLHGSYIRVGDADKPMTEYEVYSYEAFRQKYRDDIRPVERASIKSLDKLKVNDYLNKKKEERPNFAIMSLEEQYEMASITRDGQITLSALLLFGLYPQAFFPQLSIIATCTPSNEIGIVDNYGNRFIDSKRIEGTLPDMLEEALAFVRKNMKIATKIDANTGLRIDIPQYPLNAVREAILNALIHRDYSFHTEGMPIQLIIYPDRLEIKNPGGLYGRLTVDQLGKIQPDTRNPILVTAMELINQAENRYSGIPTIRYALKELSLPEPIFTNARGLFAVTMYNKDSTLPAQSMEKSKTSFKINDEKGLIAFCQTARSRQEIIEFLAIPSANYALHRYLTPLIQAKAILMTIPDKPRSKKQKFISANCF